MDFFSLSQQVQCWFVEKLLMLYVNFIYAPYMLILYHVPYMLILCSVPYMLILYYVPFMFILSYAPC